MIKELIKLTKNNLASIFKFEFVFRLITSIIAMPIVLSTIKLTMRLTGFKYLSLDNILKFILNPITIPIFIILILLISFYTIFEIGTLVYLFASSKQNKKVELKDIIKKSLKKSLQVFKKENIGLLIVIFILTASVSVGLSSGILSSISIPEFIMEYITKNNILLALFLLIALILLIMLFRWLYALHYFFLEDKNFKESIKSSTRLGYKNHFKDFIKIMLVQLIIYVLFVGLTTLGIVSIIYINKWLQTKALLESIVLSSVIIFIAFILIIASVITSFATYLSVSALFYKHKETKNEKIIEIKLNEKDKKLSKSVWKYTVVSIMIVGFIFLSGFIYMVINGKYKLNIMYEKNMEITAHRGASLIYPENTLISFIGAKELKSDWVELDVQQTKDKEIIISHDKNLKRVTGKKVNVWEINYIDILKLDAGSYKDKSFKDEKIPLLKDVIIWAKENNMKLNIELKPTGHEQDFTKQVIDIINEYDFKESCVLASMNYNILEEAKEIDSSIKTAYVMSLAFGNLLEFDKADCFSIESSSITEDIVTILHKNNKQVFGWTVNTEENINKLIDLEVDNIITDDVVLAKEVLEKRNDGSLISVINNIINELLK